MVSDAGRFRRLVGSIACGLLLSVGCTYDGAPPPIEDATESSAQAAAFPGEPPDGTVAPFERAEPYQPTAAGAPPTDIWLGTLAVEGEALTVRNLRNVTDRDGYDNQPAFSPDGDAIWYTSAVDTTQTEIFRYEITSGTTEQVTHTPDASEFSPTFIPGQNAISVTRETAELQHLWRYGMDGVAIGPIFGAVRPVGYHAWGTGEWTAMDVVTTPSTLQVGNAMTGEIRVVAEGVGRSLHRIPGTSDISFVHMISEEEWSIERLDPTGGEPERLTLTLPGREDYAWAPDGAILMGDGTTLHAWRAGSGWSVVAELAADGRGDISRIAVSPDGTAVAIVMNRDR